MFPNCTNKLNFYEDRFKKKVADDRSLGKKPTSTLDACDKFCDEYSATCKYSSMTKDNRTTEWIDCDDDKMTHLKHSFEDLVKLLKEWPDPYQSDIGVFFKEWWEFEPTCIVKTDEITEMVSALYPPPAPTSPFIF